MEIRNSYEIQWDFMSVFEGKVCISLHAVVKFDSILNNTKNKD